LGHGAFSAKLSSPRVHDPVENRRSLPQKRAATSARTKGGAVNNTPHHPPPPAQAARAFPNVVITRQRSGRPIAPLDAMIASIAKSRGSAVATRNTRDFEHCGIRILNP